MLSLDSERLKLEKESLQLQLLTLKQEKLRRLIAPLRNYKPSNLPEHNQLSFHQSEAFIRILFGGNQSGKSLSTAAEASFWATGTHPFLKVNHKSNRIWVIAPEYRLIYEGIWRHLRPDGRNYNGIGFLSEDDIKRTGPKHPQTDLPAFIEVRSKAGGISRIDFVTVEGSEQGRRRVQAAAVDLMIVDEEIDEVVFEEIPRRLLATNGKLAMSLTAVRSDAYILELEDRFLQGDKDVFITTLNTAHNKYLDPEQVKRVYKSDSQEVLDVRLRGKTRRDHNLVYPEFERTHMIEPFPIPHEWPKFCFLDPGFRIFAGAWFAVDPDKDLCYQYREMYLEQCKLQDVAKFIYHHERLHPGSAEPIDHVSEKVERYIDPNAAAHLQTGEPGILALLAGLYNLQCIPAFNSKEAGITAVRKMLDINDMYNVPMLRFFNTCTNTFKEFRNYKVFPTNSSRFSNEKPDTPIKRKDHLMDCIKYFALQQITNIYEDAKPKKGFASGRLTPNMLSQIRKVRHPILGSEF